MLRESDEAPPVQAGAGAVLPRTQHPPARTTPTYVAPFHGLRSLGANIPRKRAFLSMVSPLPRLPWRLSSPSCSRQRSPRCVAPRGEWRHSLSSARLSCPATPPREPPCMGPLGCRCGWHTCSGARTRHGIALSCPLSRWSPSTTAHQIACTFVMRSSQ